MIFMPFGIPFYRHTKQTKNILLGGTICKKKKYEDLKK